MSRYGRLWDKASTYWRQIQTLQTPLLVVNSPEDAKKQAREVAAKLVAEVDALADQWAEIKAEMDKEPG